MAGLRRRECWVREAELQDSLDSHHLRSWQGTGNVINGFLARDPSLGVFLKNSNEQEEAESESQNRESQS